MNELEYLLSPKALKLLSNTIDYCCFIKIAGSTNAGLMLYHSTFCLDGNEDGWFSKSREEWQEEIGLGRHEQETARKILKDKGFLEEKKAGIPARLFYRANIKQIDLALCELADQAGK